MFSANRKALFLVLLLLTLTTAPRAVAQPAGDAIRSARSGPWSDKATWVGGKVPTSRTKVYIARGHTVVYDVASDDIIRSLHIDGILTFAPDRDTVLEVGLIRVQANGTVDEDGFDCNHMTASKHAGEQAALLVGTPNQPIGSKHTALIRLVYINEMDRNSCPAIVCCGGRMDFHGSPMNRTWVRLSESVKPGDTIIKLDTQVTGWKAGDRIIVTATTNADAVAFPTTEERFIKEISMASREGERQEFRITLDKGLTHAHMGGGNYRAEVANLSRNVVVESADRNANRGHTMYHRNSAGSISYAEFRHLGKKGILGRYSLHYHLCGDTMRGSSVVGASIWDSANRWLTIHGTNYLVVRDCVGYGSQGHGFFLEDGTEVFNVLDRNLAVGAVDAKKLQPHQALPFDENNGAGFWWANCLNTFTRNVATENGTYGFRYEATPSSQFPLTLRVQQPNGTRKFVDIRTLPFVRFDDNDVHSSRGQYGFNLGEGVAGIGPDIRHPFVVRNTKIWNVHYAFRPQVPSLRVENMTIHKAEYGVYHPNYDRHEYKNLLISDTPGEPFNRGHDDDSVQFGPLTVDGLTFDGCNCGDMPLIQISDDNPTGKAVTHLRNVKTLNWKDNSKGKALINLGGGPRPTPKTRKGVPVFVHDWYGPGRHAEVVSIRSGEYTANPARYRKDSPLTGDESRVAEVGNIEFPKLLDPIDDLPPMTVITHLKRDGTTLLVRGTTSDNGTVKRVVVNGVEARAVTSNFAEWEVVLPGAANINQVTALAEDMAGNVEPRPHLVMVGG